MTDMKEHVRHEEIHDSRDIAYWQRRLDLVRLQRDDLRIEQNRLRQRQHRIKNMIEDLKKWQDIESD